MRRKPPMQIRPLIDLPEHVDVVTRWLWDQWPDANSTIEERRERLMLVDDCPPALLALSENEPVGVLAFRRHPRNSSVRRALFIDALYVHASCRDRGIGAALVAEAVLAARDFERELFVFTDKRDYYEKRGWSLHAIDPKPNHVVLVRQIAE